MKFRACQEDRHGECQAEIELESLDEDCRIVYHDRHQCECHCHAGDTRTEKPERIRRLAKPRPKLSVEAPSLSTEDYYGPRQRTRHRPRHGRR